MWGMNIRIFCLGTVQLVDSGMQNSCKNKKYDKNVNKRCRIAPFHSCKNKKHDKNIDRKRKELHVCVALKVLVGASVK